MIHTNGEGSEQVKETCPFLLKASPTWPSSMTIGVDVFVVVFLFFVFWGGIFFFFLCAINVFCVCECVFP